MKPIDARHVNFCERTRCTGLTDSRNGGDDLAELELVQDGGLTSGIETDLRHVQLILLDRFNDCGGQVYIPSVYLRVAKGVSTTQVPLQLSSMNEYARISFLPKRPERRRETERPIVESS